MNGKIYLIECTAIVLILTLFDPSSSIQNMLIAFIIVIIQIGFDKLRLRNRR